MNWKRKQSEDSSGTSASVEDDMTEVFCPSFQSTIHLALRSEFQEREANAPTLYNSFHLTEESNSVHEMTDNR